MIFFLLFKSLGLAGPGSYFTPLGKGSSTILICQLQYQRWPRAHCNLKLWTLVSGVKIFRSSKQYIHKDNMFVKPPTSRPSIIGRAQKCIGHGRKLVVWSVSIRPATRHLGRQKLYRSRRLDKILAYQTTRRLSPPCPTRSAF
jgi:hypothetical protein